ncbi:uncharacterized protein LOC129793847 [Lutzomyia longipalpis]|uniref:uncharacterized protein LOC129793847 n=1 Tax=Lutzomyia longipalpis TaxID=7200 RepID=UPI002483F622|nr:uncharacterized protein LOC129793847 [Lutzomyia longipalpis]XP_055690270.1 uncharacterized protein LOC129793847 [Lutzomyia longipalpis]XP_055690271.1 uncharacterized protein LOC129793847 [Lutzomyia longipalpis]
MSLEIRGAILARIAAVERFVDDITDVDKQLAGYSANLANQLDIVLALRQQYLNVQEEIIVSKELELHKATEIVNLEDFTQRCDLLVAKLKKLLADAPGSPTDGKPIPTASGELMQQFLAFMQQSEKRYYASEVQNRESMQMLINTLKELPLGAPSGSALPVITVKLPQLQLPTFDGTYGSWHTFKDRFTASVINYPHISDVQKLEYLKSAVSGDAASCIKHINTTGVNFIVAWRILLDKFERKNDIVAEHIKTFFAMPQMSSSPQAIHDITNIATECTMALDALRVVQRDPWLIQFILERLDTESRVLWGRECGPEVPSLGMFIKFLNQRCLDVRNSTQASTKPPSGGDQNARSHSSKSQPNKHHASAFINSASSDLCRCCKESSHPLDKCPIFLRQSPDERFETVKRLSLCRNCFATHMTHSCTYNRCRKCQGRHNVLLHEKYSSTTGDPSTSSPSASTVDNASDAQSSTSSTGSSATVAVCSASGIHHSDSPPRVFLATALVDLQTAAGKTIPCRILLDSGAQINVIASDLANLSNLPRHPTCISVDGLGATTSRARFFVNATVVSKTTGIRIALKCYILPQIPGTFPNWPVDSSKMRIPQDIPLADPDWAVQRPVDILISGKHFWDCFLNDSISLGPGRPMLKASVFGHVVVGEDEVMSASDCLTFTATTPESSLHQVRAVEDVPVKLLQLENQFASPSHSASAHQCMVGENLLPLLLFNHPLCILGESRGFVIRQFHALEHKFHNVALQMPHCKVLDDLQCVQWLKPLCDDSNRSPTQCVHHNRALINLTRIMLQKSLQEDCIQPQPESSGSTWLTQLSLPNIQSTTAHCCRILTQRKYQVQNIMPVSEFRNASHCISRVHQLRILERAAENIAQPGSIQPRNWKWLNTLPFPLDPRTLSYQEGHMLHQDNHPIVLPKLNRLKFIIWQEYFRQLQPIHCWRKENLPQNIDIPQLAEEKSLCSYRSEDRMDHTGENVGAAGKHFIRSPKVMFSETSLHSGCHIDFRLWRKN